MEFQYTETFTPVLLMKFLQSRRQRDERIWVNTVCILISPKNRNCEICKRTKITRAPCRRRNGEALLRAETSGALITADHKVLSDIFETRNNHQYAIGAGLSHSMDPGISVQNKTHTKPREACKSSWNPKGNQKSFTLTNSL